MNEDSNLPRGVYDRSKAKKRRDAAETAPAKSPGRPGRKPKAVSIKETAEGLGYDLKEKRAARHTDKEASEAIYEKNAKNFGTELTLNVLQASINTLTNARTSVSSGNEQLTSAIDSALAKAVDKYTAAIDQLFPDAVEARADDNEEVEEVKTEAKNGAVPVPSPITSAPVPFNPPAFASTQA